MDSQSTESVLEDGQRAIEEVEAGDKVWAYDEETGGKALKEVEEVFVSETDKLIHVETDKEEIVTTELHPFYVEGLGFVQAGCLQEGYELVCLDGGKETITDVRVEWLEEEVKVYNFRVADYHTYFVGDGDVLVHNTCSKSGVSDDNTYAQVKVSKFSDYIFKEGATHGKNVVFENLGYGRADSDYLARIYAEQANLKYINGEYTLGKLDQYGQRINIEIELNGIGKYSGKTSYLKSGWMINADGTISLNTPFSGFTREGGLK